jgi:hypothetical protein
MIVLYNENSKVVAPAAAPRQTLGHQASVGWICVL